jgi:hypothetical protein
MHKFHGTGSPHKNKTQTSGFHLNLNRKSTDNKPLALLLDDKILKEAEEDLDDGESLMPNSMLRKSNEIKES